MLAVTPRRPEEQQMTKTRIVRTGLLTGLILASAAGGMMLQGEASAFRGQHRNGFSVADVRGNYGVIEWGFVNGESWTETALIQADGAGTMSIEFIGNIANHTPVAGTLPCTYDVRTNGMGQMVCTGEGEAIIVDFVLVDNAREIRFMTAPGGHGVQALGTARLQ
jgi:hypothetical protein